MPKQRALREGSYTIGMGSRPYHLATGRQESDRFVVEAGSQIKRSEGKQFGKHQDLRDLRVRLAEQGVLVWADQYGSLREDVPFLTAYKAACFVKASDPQQSVWKEAKDPASEALKDGILRSFEKVRPTYVELVEALRSELDAYLRQCHLAYTVQARAKSPESLRGKLDRKLIEKPEEYRSLADLTDLAGLRFLVYQPSEIEVVRERVRSHLATRKAVEHFEIQKVSEWDDKATRTRTEGIDQDSFYQAWHLTVRFRDPEEGALIAEIQVTDIMSHVINEIGHDLIYKNSRAIESVKNSNTNQAKNVARLYESFRALHNTLESAKDAVDRVAHLAALVSRTTTRH